MKTNWQVPRDSRDMKDDELEWRLREALRSGEFDRREQQGVLGYFAACKRLRNGGKGPSGKQERWMRSLVDRTLVGSLVDDDNG